MFEKYLTLFLVSVTLLPVMISVGIPRPVQYIIYFTLSLLWNTIYAKLGLEDTQSKKSGQSEE